MAHHKDLAALSDELRQGIGRHPGANFGTVIRLLGAAAVEGEIVPVLDHRLVAAPGQGHLNAEGSKVVTLFKAGSVPPDSQGNGGSNACGADHLADLLQEVELVFNGHLQIPYLEHEEEAVSLQPPEHTVIVLGAAGDHLVELCVQGGDGALRQVLGELVIIVHQDNGHHRPGADVLVPHLVQLR